MMTGRVAVDDPEVTVISSRCPIDGKPIFMRLLPLHVAQARRTRRKGLSMATQILLGQVTYADIVGHHREIARSYNPGSLTFGW